MKDHFILKRYEDPTLYLKEMGPYLHKQEIYNSIFINQLETEASNPASQCFFNVLIDPTTDTLVFTLMALKDSFLYGSGMADGIPRQDYPSIVECLVTDFLTVSFPFISIQSYEPVLSILRDTLAQSLKKEFKFIDDVWSVSTESVQWSPRALSIKDKTELRQATLNDLPLVMAWTEGHLHDIAEDETYAMHPPVEPLCREKISQGCVYLLYGDKVPKSMAYKTRPLIHGCSIGFVYTPTEHRHKGYASACISMLTETLLKEYTYIALFVAGERDPKNNLYTTVGYTYFGKAARYTLVT